MTTHNILHQFKYQPTAQDLEIIGRARAEAFAKANPHSHPLWYDENNPMPEGLRQPQTDGGPSSDHLQIRLRRFNDWCREVKKIEPPSIDPESALFKECFADDLLQQRKDAYENQCHNVRREIVHAFLNSWGDERAIPAAWLQMVTDYEMKKRGLLEENEGK